MTESDQPQEADSQDDPVLQQQIDALKTLLETFTQDIIQDVTAIQAAADGLLYGLQRGRSFSHERLRASLDLIAIACRQATERIEQVRRTFPSV